jgi:WD40 repeat protein
LLFKEDENLLITGTIHGYIRCWNFLNGEIVQFKSFKTCATSIKSLLSLPGGYFASLSDGKIEIWSTKDFQCVNEIQSDENVVKTLLLLTDGRIAASSCRHKITI